MRARIGELVAGVRAASARLLNHVDAYFIPDVLRQENEAYQKARLAMRFSLGLVLATLIFGLSSLVQGRLLLVLAPGLGLGTATALFVLIRVFKAGVQHTLDQIETAR